ARRGGTARSSSRPTRVGATSRYSRYQRKEKPPSTAAAIPVRRLPAPLPRCPGTERYCDEMRARLRVNPNWFEEELVRLASELERSPRYVYGSRDRLSSSMPCPRCWPRPTTSYPRERSPLRRRPFLSRVRRQVRRRERRALRCPG